MMKDNASTDVIVHRGEALASFYQCGELYRLDPHTLETKGTTEWGGFFPQEGVSAHPRVDPRSRCVPRKCPPRPSRIEASDEPFDR